MAKPARKTINSGPIGIVAKLVGRNGILADVEILPKTALIAGATGLVGKELLRLLLEDPNYQQIVVFSRRPPETIHPKLTIIEGSLDDLAAYHGKFQADHAFCCLGTTMAQAGSKEAFRKVDFDYVLAFAKLARSCGVERFALVSALGADASSAVFYNKVKGEAEEALQQIHFKHSIILRPSILLGQRNQNRPAEKTAQWVAEKMDFLFVGPLAKYRGVKAVEVAAAALYLCATTDISRRVAENDELHGLAALYRRTLS